MSQVAESGDLRTLAIRAKTMIKHVHDTMDTSPKNETIAYAEKTVVVCNRVISELEKQPHLHAIMDPANLRDTVEAIKLITMILRMQ